MATYIVRHGYGLFGESYDVGKYYIEEDAMSHYERLAERLGPDESAEVRKYDNVGEHMVAHINTFNA